MAEDEKELKPKIIEGAPEWMVTYGDLMTLMLCFFVLLFSMSVIHPRKFTIVSGSLRERFLNPVPEANPPPASDPLISDLIVRLQEETFKGGERVKKIGVYTFKIESIREGLMITIGGKSFFNTGQYQLRRKPGTEQVDDGIAAALNELMSWCSGTLNIIEVRGHTSGEEEESMHRRTGGALDVGRWDLSWYRALNVVEYLTEEQRQFNEQTRTEQVIPGLDKGRFFIAGSSRNEPVSPNLFEAKGREMNRRVEVIVRHKHVSQRRRR